MLLVFSIVVVVVVVVVIVVVVVVIVVVVYSGEISPTRCNNCVFYSQWLYSTCFG